MQTMSNRKEIIPIPLDGKEKEDDVKVYVNFPKGIIIEPMKMEYTLGMDGIKLKENLLTNTESEAALEEKILFELEEGESDTDILDAMQKVFLDWQRRMQSDSINE
jgi:hypothetical protein